MIRHFCSFGCRGKLGEEYEFVFEKPKKLLLQVAWKEKNRMYHFYRKSIGLSVCFFTHTREELLPVPFMPLVSWEQRGLLFLTSLLLFLVLRITCFKSRIWHFKEFLIVPVDEIILNSIIWKFSFRDW